MEDFVLEEAVPADVSVLARLIYNGWSDDAFWQIVLGDGTADQVLRWLEGFLAARFSQPHNKTFKIAEVSTGRIVAYTNLLWPALEEHNEEAGKKQDGMTKSKEQPPPPPFITNASLWTAFQVSLSTSRFGYDSTQHFHRRGTFVDVKCQRKGFGKWLTRHCNAIADEYGAATFVGAKKKSRGMFAAMGFQAVGVIEMDVSDWGGPGGERFNCLRRLPWQECEIQGIEVPFEKEKF
ncbi:hypothetical protein K431DRAFT_283890 [Polychaeton citri CBS 116435]|uniref:N-acetyltransferase domain-containing protein n=1 Tax=Polychaeton citri CBS 116435 TaxID=1314669 RepID=A0A9P4UR57_9PEZI|nr:hypothetical protein K431DRAFT_283890 [Polychaeton citri CBS 116435]